METTRHTNLLRIIVRLKEDVPTWASDTLFFKCKHHRHQCEQMEYKNTNYKICVFNLLPLVPVVLALEKKVSLAHVGASSFHRTIIRSSLV